MTSEAGWLPAEFQEQFSFTVEFQMLNSLLDLAGDVAVLFLDSFPNVRGLIWKDKSSQFFFFFCTLQGMHQGNYVTASFLGNFCILGIFFCLIQ